MEPDVNQQILQELRGMRRLAKRGWITALALFIAFIALITLFWLPFKGSDPYSEVMIAMRAGDYRRAIEIAQKLAADRPRDYQMQEYLGAIYLIAGETTKAEEAYSRAYALSPPAAYLFLVRRIPRLQTHARR